MVTPSEPLISVVIRENAPLPEAWTEEWRQEEEGDEIACGHSEGNPLFVFRSHGKMAGWMECGSDYRRATVYTGELPKLAIDNAMMIASCVARLVVMNGNISVCAERWNIPTFILVANAAYIWKESSKPGLWILTLVLVIWIQKRLRLL